MEKFLYYNELYLIYKGLLNEKNSLIFDLYYGDNMTMQEIADLKNVSKSRVGSIIKNVQNKLDKYESVLHLYEKKEKLSKILELNDLEKIKILVEDILNWKGE